MLLPVLLKENGNNICSSNSWLLPPWATKCPIVDIWQGSKYAYVISEHAWICWNMHEFLYLKFSVVILCLFEVVVTYFNVYMLTRSYSLRDYKVVLFKMQNLIFAIVAGSIWFVFCLIKSKYFPRFKIELIMYQVHL